VTTDKTQSHFYREKAQEGRDAATREVADDRRERWYSMAQQWLKLAADAERRSSKKEHQGT
jgi:hypothetical protein